MEYFSTFISGLQEVIRDILSKTLDDVNIIGLYDGAVHYATAKPFGDIQFYCFNNTFRVIDVFKTTSAKPIEAHLKKCTDSKIKFSDMSGVKNNKTFRIVTSYENNLIAIDNDLKSKMEKLIEYDTGLTLNRSIADTEYWYLYRSEKISYFMQRLTRHKAYNKKLKKGELSPELAYILNWISDPSETDIMIDPFCGHGSIPIQRMKHFKTKKIYAFDIDGSLSSDFSNGNNIIFKKIDIKKLADALFNGCADKIVTDPPWGLYKDENITDLYNDMMKNFDSVLKKGGIAVILTARKNEFIDILTKFDSFKLLNEYSILVSGKKAGVYKLMKI